MSQIVGHDTAMMRINRPRLWLPVLVFLLTVASLSPGTSSTAEIESPDLIPILQRMEDVEHENPAQSRSYEVTREYKVFRGDDKQPSSEVMAEISFVPPYTKTYKITQVEGKSRGEKMVRELLDQEVEAATKSHESEISRANYDFVFLRREKLEIADDYVLRIIPKRKEKYLFRGQIWVDTTTLHIRRVEGVPAKSPSFWLTGIRVTIQFAQVSDKWIPISFDAIATVRFLGHYTIAGLNIPADNPPQSPCSSIQSRKALAGRCPRKTICLV